MQNKHTSEQQYLDVKSIPKIEFQFSIFEEELHRIIRQIKVQTQQQQKIINQHKRQLSQKLSIQAYVDSIKQLEKSIQFPVNLQKLIPSSVKKNHFNDISKPVLTSTVQISNKFIIFSEILSVFNSKIQNLEKRITQSEQKTNKNVKQKVSSLEQQLTGFVQDYRLGFKNLADKFEENKLNIENKTKQIETNTLWKINECSKRLDDRPNVQMIKKSLFQLQNKITQLVQSSGGVSNKSGFNDTVKLQQDLMKLRKLMDFNMIELQSQIKQIKQKIQTGFMNLNFYAEQKLQMTKKFQHLNVSNSDFQRKIRAFQTFVSQSKQSEVKAANLLNEHDEDIKKVKQKIQRFSKNDQFAKLLQKIDPHEICRLTESLRSLQEKSVMTDQKINSLKTFIDAIRSKMEFWNIANGQNPQKQHQNDINVEILTKIIKNQISNSQFKTKLMKFQHQILDLASLKQGINEIIKKMARVNKDNDLTNLKYQIQGVQQYFKKQIMILNNKINSLQVTINNKNDLGKRPFSSSGKQSDGKLFTSISTKKLLPVNCISCHQTNTILTERQRKTVFNSKFVLK